MHFNKFAFICILAGMIFCSCSGSGKSPISIEPTESDSPVISEIAPDDSNRTVLAVYDTTIDPAAGKFTVTPSSRTADYHFPLTQLYPNVVQIVGHGWNPIFWVDIKLIHPFPGSGIDAFDPRVIAILPANSGVSFYYPIFNCRGNNKVVLEPDGYTKLFDNLGGGIPGNTNPFKVYFKDQPYRVWSSTGVTSETQRWNMSLSGFGGPMQFKLVVDVSTNYPNPPTPVTDNVPEPVQIDTSFTQRMTSSGGSTEIEVTFLDWQSPGDIKCKVECPQLFNGAIQLIYEAPGPNPNEYIFSGTISNELLAPAGEYGLLIAAWDVPSDPDIHVFKEAIARVIDEIVFDPVDISPTWLSFSPYDILIEGNYAYIASLYNGFHIFDISSPLNPVPVSWVDIPIDAFHVYLNSGYAYVVVTDDWDDIYSIEIIDIDPPEDAHKAKSITLPDSLTGFYITNDYAYITIDTRYTPSSIFEIIDISPPESATVVKTLETPGEAYDVDADGGYAYVADGESGLQIIDVDPPEDASIVKAVDTPNSALDLALKDGYVFIADGLSGVEIVDVNPINDAYIVKRIDYLYASNSSWIEIIGNYAYVIITEDADNDYKIDYSSFVCINTETPEDAKIASHTEVFGQINAIDITDGYAYVNMYSHNDEYARFEIIDIDPPDNINVIKEVEIDGWNYGVDSTDGYSYVVDERYGFQIIDIDPPENASIAKLIPTLNSAQSVYVTDGYAYVTNSDLGFHIIDIDPLQTASIVKSIETPDHVLGVTVSGGYAYLAGWYAGLHIIDIEPIENSNIVKSVDTPGRANKVFLKGSYAYVADSDSGLQIIDIEPPENASIIKTVDTPGSAYDVQVAGGYAYVADGSSGLQIIDIDPITSASIIKSVDTPKAAVGVSVDEGYAYIADGSSGLQIIDIQPVNNASIVKSIATPDRTRDVYEADGYAYVVDDTYGLLIMDVEPVENASIIESVDTPGRAMDIFIDGEYAFIADYSGGFRVIKLW